MPLNVDDADLDHDMDKLPEPREGFTEMTLSLIEFELVDTLRRVLQDWYSTGSNAVSSVLERPAVEERMDWVIHDHQRIEQTYLAGLDLSYPAAWVAVTLARLLMSRMWLMVFCPTPRPDESTLFSENIAERLLLASVETIEEGNRLDNDIRASQWWWYFRMNLQWHSTVFTLSELGEYSEGDLADRAWDAIEEMVRGRFQSEGTGAQRRVLLWQYLRRLLIKARMAREKTLLEISLVRRGGDSHRPLASYPAIDELLASESRAAFPTTDAMAL